MHARIFEGSWGVANAVFRLSPDEAAWINGDLLRVDGGAHVAGASS